MAYISEDKRANPDPFNPEDLTYIIYKACLDALPKEPEFNDYCLLIGVLRSWAQGEPEFIAPLHGELSSVYTTLGLRNDLPRSYGRICFKAALACAEYELYFNYIRPLLDLNRRQHGNVTNA